MSKYLLLLGTTPELSLLEVESLLRKQVNRWQDRLVAVNLESDQAAKQLMLVLGGTVKILKIVTKLDQDEQQALSEIAHYLEQNSDRPTFGISAPNVDSYVFKPQIIKKSLRQLGVSSRYRKSGNWGLSAAILIHQTDVFDLLVLEQNGQRFLAQTVAAQDIDDWTKRDRQKPYANHKKGMLPPKVARMMVNIGLGHLDQSRKKHPVLYDPYVGSGTVLIEGLVRGCQVVGSDLDHDSVAGTLENLYWLEQEYDQDFKYKVFQSDVAHVSKRDWQTQVDLVVTEPFLGKQTPHPKELDNIFTGLERTYLGAFKTWKEILKDRAVIVTVFPLSKTEHKTYDMSDLIDKLAKYGYTLEVKPKHYAREKAIIERQIYVFRYQK